MHIRAALFGFLTFCLVNATVSVKAQTSPTTSPSTIDARTPPEAIPTERVNTDNNGLTKPGRAALYSAIIPGAGQIYNKHYWKVPVIYAVGAGIGYAIVFNHREYMAYKQSYEAELDGNPDTEPLRPGSVNFLRLNRNAYHNDRDLSIIIAVLAYGMNIVEANVGAHLNEFDVSDDLSLRWSPSVQYIAAGPVPVPGISLNLHLKK
ncbi:MAG TPA: DUF5683 domain-containing protein [Adhaeribacter sp.]|nr:DUF5683 domain-containing protein [Adhaeribacter sp.]